MKPKIVLASISLNYNYLLTRHYYRLPNLGIGYIASFLRKNQSDIEIKIIDLTLYKNWKHVFKKILENFKPNIIGFSILTLAYNNAIELKKIAKNFDFVEKVIFSGVHPSACSKLVLKENPDVIVVKGEGEITMLEIVREKKLSEIKGVSFIKNNKIWMFVQLIWRIFTY